MLRAFSAAVATLIVVSITVSPVANANNIYTCNGDFTLKCEWTVTDSGTQPAVTDPVYSPASSGSSSDEVPDPCVYELWDQPPPDDPVWGDNDPAHGRLWAKWCPRIFGDGVTHMVINGAPYYVGDGDTPDGQAAAIDPMVLVARAKGSITLPTPTPSFGPDRQTAAVKVPVWFATDAFPPITRTATAGRVSATVTARLAETVWQPGEPLDPEVPGDLAPAVTCAGGGVRFAPGADPGSPPCGYTYRWRSLPERTGGAGTWPVTVTNRYVIDWTVTAPGGTQTGSDTAETHVTTPLLVREWHSILVNEMPAN